MLGGLRGACARFAANDGLFLAAGLAFSFLVCMIPLVLIGVTTASVVLPTQEAAREVIGQLTRTFPVYRQEVARVLLRIAERRAVSGLLGLAILVLFSTPLFGSARLVVNRMLGLRPRANPLRGLLRDALMVLLLVPLLFAATAVTWAVAWLQALAVAAGGLGPRGVHRVTLALSLALSMVMFTLAYRYLPARRVRLGPALAGAALTSLLWEAAKQLFRLWVVTVGVHGQIYGPLGVLIAVVMFVYYSALVFVFGAAFVAALEARRR